MRKSRILILNACAEAGLVSSAENALKPATDFTVEAVPDSLARCEPIACRLAARRAIARFQPDVALLCLAQVDWAACGGAFAAVREELGATPVVLIVDSLEPQSLYDLLKQGAADFLSPPLRSEEISPRLWRLLEHTFESNTPAANLKESLGLKQFVGESHALIEHIKKIPKIGRSDCSVLIGGETGTGKEMFARAIHYLSPRSAQAFVPVNCGAIPSDLVENELFGHEEGAFTGATSSAHGLIEAANTGTLFLDEIDSLPPSTQVKLLRFLQDREYRPLGATRLRRSDVRVIAAANVNLQERISEGRFRSDLFYRLNVLSIRLPALRERRSDIPVLARHFAARHARETSTPLRDLAPSALRKLMSFDWPGNVRELENVIESALVLSDHALITDQDILLPVIVSTPAESSFKILKAKEIAEFESSFVREALSASQGNISEAARTAKKHRRAFWQLMRKHKIGVPEPSHIPCHRTNSGGLEDKFVL